jgi:hypothetical protein
MTEYGVLLGVLLLALVTATALLLAGKAAASVRQFREEQHETFTGGRKEDR